MAEKEKFDSNINFEFRRIRCQIASQIYQKNMLK